jgi:hypothetical protein
MRTESEAAEGRHQGIVIAVVSSAIVLGLTGAILIALYFTRANEVESADHPERAPTLVVTAKKGPLVTESTPVKAATSAPEPAQAAPPPAVPVQSRTAAPPAQKPDKPEARW